MIKKTVKILALSSLLMIVFVYVFIGNVYLNWYSDIITTNKVSFKSRIASIIVQTVGRDVLERIYSFKSPFMTNNSDYNFIFSDDDVLVNDSTIFHVLNHKKTFADDIKTWRKARFLSPDGSYKIKYKFHGTSLSQYQKGFASFKIKSKDPILGRRNFRLYSSIEMGYSNIFINSVVNSYGLISEEVGTLIPVSGYMGVDLYYMTSGISTDYLKMRYNIEDYIMFNSNDVWHNMPIPHVDSLDGIGYSIDWNSEDIIDHKGHEYLDMFISMRKGNTDLSKSQLKQYLGKYLGLLYFFGHPHQVTGDNDIWIGFNNELMPVYRNEGQIDALCCNKYTLDNYIWSIYLPSRTLIPYKKFLTNDSIRKYRNEVFYNLVSNKNAMLHQFDSIFNYWDQTIYDFDSRYYFLKQKHKKYRQNIIKNINVINDYIQVTELACYYYNDTLNIAADSYVDIEILINGELFSTICPRVFSFRDDKIVTSIIDMKFPYGNDIQSIYFRNSITKDTIQGDKLIMINL